MSLLKLSVPFNNQDDLIPGLAGYPEVAELYGKLPADCVGGGKHSFQLPRISRTRFAENVGEAHKRGLRFNYLLNSSCLDNREWTRAGQKQITRLLDWVVGLGVGEVTVTIPYLLELIKKRYPGLTVHVSTLAGVNSPQRAKYWEGLGADVITLLNVDANRNFPLLREIRKGVGCRLKLILNVNCLSQCPFYLYHANVSSHASQSGHPLGGYVIDYCRIRCRYQQLVSPVDLIRSSWIRPEDVRYYEEAGIDMFKIIDRGMTTATITAIVDAYAKRRFEGNLLELFPDPSKSMLFRKPNLLVKARYFLRPFSVNVFKLRKFSGLLNNAVFVDNRKLDGLLQGIIEKDCALRSCRGCTHCFEYARRSVSIDEKLNETVARQYRRCLEEMSSGSLFRYP